MGQVKYENRSTGEIIPALDVYRRYVAKGAVYLPLLVENLTDAIDTQEKIPFCKSPTVTVTLPIGALEAAIALLEEYEPVWRETVAISSARPPESSDVTTQK